MSMPAIAYAARHPARLTHLVLWMAFARGDGLFTTHGKEINRLALIDWKMASETAIRAVDNWEHEELATQMAAMMRGAVTPETFVKFEEERDTWDVTDLLPEVTAPTLVIHPRSHPYFNGDAARQVAGGIPGARLVFTDSSSVLFADPKVAFLIGDFLGVNQEARAATPQGTGTVIILFADIASSTALTERMGDAAFRDRSRAIDAAVRDAALAAGGTPVEGKVMGDGVMSTFGSARQAIDAALRCREASAQHELPLHLGIHAGDVIRERDNVYGGAVNIAARICDASSPGEILVSEIVRGLARTSAGVTFDDRGEHVLRGIDEPQRLWAVVAQSQ
jgi:class 3 adenylate cyclase